MRQQKIILKLNIALALLAAVAGLLTAALPAAAESQVAVKIGDINTTTWEIGPIAPGDSGEQIVSVKNSGTRTGNLNIWLSNINGQEGTPAEFVEGTPSAGGDLSKFLLLDLSADGLTSSISLPATIDRFPVEVSTTSYLSVAGIRANRSVTLTWHWLLPSQTGNAVQGDSLGFDINYTLTEIPPNSGGAGGGGRADVTPTPSPTSIQATPPVPAPATVPLPDVTPLETATIHLLELDLPDASSTASITDKGVLIDTLSATTADQTFSLTIDSGTRLSVSNEDRPNGVPLTQIGASVPDKISVAILQSAVGLPLPPGWERVSPLFDINGLTNGYTHGIKMSTPAHLVIQYDSALLPQNVDSLATFYYSYQYGWTQLQSPQGFIAEAGQTAADTDHFSLFAILARAGKETPLPANFVITRLTLDPPRITVEQSSEVRVRVSNTGGLAGDYSVVVKVNGKVQKTQSIKLGAGESREIHLILSPGLSGIYTVEAAGASAQLVVDSLPQPDVVETNYWWLLLISMGCATLVLAILVRKRRPSGGRA